MAINYNFRIEGDTFFNTATGFDESLSDTVEYTQKLCETAIRSNCKKVLSDERMLEYRLKIAENFTHAELFSKINSHISKIAIVTNFNNKENADFWETVVQNRISNVRIFYDIDLATQWLKDQVL